MMDFIKRHRAIIGSLAAIAVSVAFLITRYVGAALDVKPNQAVGEVLADETASPGGREVVLVTLEPSLSKAVKIQTESFVRALKKKRSVRIAATERLQRYHVLRGDMQKELAPERFLPVAQTYPQAAIVSLVGAPRLTDSEIARLPQPPPKLLIVVRSDTELLRLFDSGLLRVANVPRFN